MSIDIDHLRTWIGHTEQRQDMATPVAPRALTAALDRDDPPAALGDALPPCWHWLYLLPIYRQSELSPDGHPKRGGFLPPVPLPRRMWAGSQLQFHSPIRVGQALSRTSCIADVRLKGGRVGPLVVVKVDHEIQADGELAISEMHDIIYRSAAQPGEAVSVPQRPPLAGQQAWSRGVTADAVMLFRYSALTFNGHRIHYDRKYATEVEGYPGLVVHGPLIATLLLDLLRRKMPHAQVARFDFRAVRPTFDLYPFNVCGKPSTDGKTVDLWAQDHEGFLTVQGTVTLA